MIDEDEQGRAIVWLSENCYIRVGEAVVASTADSPKIPKCSFPAGKAKARGDLFEHLKKNSPPP